MTRANVVPHDASVKIPAQPDDEKTRTVPNSAGAVRPSWSDMANNFTAQNVRDFDYLGYRYGLMSSIGTAGLNNVLAMLPARDEAEFKLFPAEDVAWINKW